MLRRSLHGDSEKIAIGRGVEKMHRRNTARSSALLLAALIAFSAATPAVAQDSNGSAPPQQSAGAGANGVYKVGGDVSAPVLIHEVKAEFSEKALHANVRGDVLVNIRVDVNGNPSHVHVISRNRPGRSWARPGRERGRGSKAVQIQARNEKWQTGNGRVEY
jgi:hypothetical protein